MEFDVQAIQDRIVPPTDQERDSARERIGSLARPRLSGSEGATEVGADLRARFEAIGYEVKELPFSYSAAPGRFALSAAGAVYTLGIIVAILFLLSGSGIGALISLVVPAAIIGGIIYAVPKAIQRLGMQRTETTNWLVHRTGVRPRYMVVAHRDSKSQMLPTTLRVAAILAGILAWIVLLVLALFEIGNPELVARPVILIAGIVGVLAGIGLALCWVANDSPGALDNATGLAALLGLAEREQASDDVAFLVTEGEELGLAGAHAVAKTLPPLEGVINLDVLDDQGDFQIVERFGYPRRGLAPHLAAALLTAADVLGLPARRRDLPPGIMVDHMAFTDAGLPSVTVHRGTNATFQRVHRAADDASRLNGSGTAATVALVSGALGILRSSMQR